MAWGLAYGSFEGDAEVFEVGDADPGGDGFEGEVGGSEEFLDALDAAAEDFLVGGSAEELAEAGFEDSA